MLLSKRLVSGFGLSLLYVGACSDSDPEPSLPRAAASSFAQDRTPSPRQVEPEASQPVADSFLSEEAEVEALLPSNGDVEPVEPEPALTTPFDIDRYEAEAILSQFCGECHGSQLSVEAASASINYMDDLEELLDLGLLIAGDAEASLVIQLMRSGSMPPLKSGGERPSEDDVDFIVEFLNTPVFF